MEENADIAISLKNIAKTFHVYDRKETTIREKVFNLFSRNKTRKIEALKGVDLEIKKGEFFGIIGSNGSGKSTLIHIMTGSLRPDKGGEAKIDGNFIRLSLGMGFNNELSAIQNILVNASVLGISRKKIKEITPEIIEFSELEKFQNTKVKYFSTGMKVRLAFAIATYADAEIFLMDEFFGSVGDERFKAKADKVFHEVLLKDRTIIHVSHNLPTIRKYCDRVLLLHKGEQIMIGTPDEVIPVYKKIMGR